MIVFRLLNDRVAASGAVDDAEMMAAALGASQWREIAALPSARQEDWRWTATGPLDVVPPDPEQVKQARIAELKQLLRDTDYVALPDYDKDKPDVLAQRQAWRDELRELSE
jgi:hypothetical protein